MCIPLSSKFLTESTGEKILKTGQYLAKIWTICNSLLFLDHRVYYMYPVCACITLSPTKC